MRRVERVDRALAVQLREAAGLECAVEVAQQHDRPVGAVGVLLVRVVAGVDDQRVVHHGAAAFGHAFQLFHEPHQHAAVVLTNLDPDRIVGLLHVPKVVPLLLDAQPLPRAEDLAAARTDGQRTLVMPDVSAEMPRSRRTSCQSVSNSGLVYRSSTVGANLRK